MTHAHDLLLTAPRQPAGRLRGGIYLTKRNLVPIKPDGMRRGATDPARAALGTIGGDHALEVQENTAHGSDSPDPAERNTRFFFPDLV
jgi:nucleoside diphosphate kinase